MKKIYDCFFDQSLIMIASFIVQQKKKKKRTFRLQNFEIFFFDRMQIVTIYLIKTKLFNLLNGI